MKIQDNFVIDLFKLIMNKDFKKLKDLFLDYWYWFILITMAIVLYILNSLDLKEIDEFKIESYGEIINENKSSKNGMNNYTYEFYYNEVKYSGNCQWYENDKIKTGEFYRVEFSSIDPNKNKINFDKVFKRELIQNNVGKITDTTYVEFSKHREIE